MSRTIGESDCPFGPIMYGLGTYQGHPTASSVFFPLNTYKRRPCSLLLLTQFPSTNVRPYVPMEKYFRPSISRRLVFRLVFTLCTRYQPPLVSICLTVRGQHEYNDDAPLHPLSRPSFFRPSFDPLSLFDSLSLFATSSLFFLLSISSLISHLSI